MRLFINTMNCYKKIIFLGIFIFIFLDWFKIDAVFAETRQYKDEGILTIWYNNLKGSLEMGNPAFDLNTNFKNNGNFKTQVNPGFSWKYNKNEKLSFDISNMNTEQKGSFSAYSLNGSGVFVNGTKFGTKAVELIGSKLNFNRVNFLMSYKLIDNDEKGSLDLLAGCELYKFEMALTNNQNSSVSSLYQRKAVLPVVGAGGVTEISQNLRLRGNFYGMKWNFKDGDSRRETTLYNYSAGVEYHILPKKDNYIVLSQNTSYIEPNDKIEWFFEAGYKEDYFKENYKKNRIILRHTGPYFNISGKY